MPRKSAGGASSQASSSQAASSQGGGKEGGDKGGKGKRKASQAQPEDEEEFDPSQSQSSQGKAKAEAAWGNMSNEDRKVSVNKIINFLLQRDADKVLTKRADINDVLKSKAAGNKAPPATVVARLIEEAKKKMQHAYGFDIVEQETGNVNDEVVSTQQSQGASKGVKVYMLVNVLKVPVQLPEPNSGEQQSQDDDEGADEELQRRELEKRLTVEKRAEVIGLGDATQRTPHWGLALTCMTLVCLKRYSMTEQELFDALKDLGLVGKNVESVLWGADRTADVLKELVSQGYLHSKKSKNRDGQPQYKYCLGLRGETEVTRTRMLNWAEHVCGEKMTQATRRDLLQEGVEEEEE